MNQTSKTILWVAGLLIVGTLVGHFVWPKAVEHVAGNSGTVSTSPSGNLSSNFTFVEASDGVLTDGFLSIGSTTPNGVNATAVGSISNLTEVITSGTCATASSTLFSVHNPLNATSTVSAIITGVGQATSSNLTVGTSTALLNTGYRQNDLSGSLVYNLGVAIATTTQFYIRSGQLSGLGTGQAPAGTSTAAINPTIVVGPNENVGAYSTSTYSTSSGGGNYVVGQTCTYKLDWKQ